MSPRTFVINLAPHSLGSQGGTPELAMIRGAGTFPPCAGSKRDRGPKPDEEGIADILRRAVWIGGIVARIDYVLKVGLNDPPSSKRCGVIEFEHGAAASDFGPVAEETLCRANHLSFSLRLSGPGQKTREKLIPTVLKLQSRLDSANNYHYAKLDCRLPFVTRNRRTRYKEAGHA